MNTYQLTALGTGPPFLLVFNETSYAEPLYVHEIVDHTHSILGSVTLIQVIQPVAGKVVTAEAVLGFTLQQLLTLFYSAGEAGYWFWAVVVPAAGAWILLSRIRDTETTVHPTGGNQLHSDSICLCCFS